MTKIVMYGVVLVALLVLGFFILNNYIYTEKQGDTLGQSGYKDVSYMIEGQEVQLVNGSATYTLGTTTTEITATYFGNEAEGDLNEDGISDIAFLLTQQGNGSGTFYYVVAALKTDTGYEGTTAGFLGDRIAPQSTSIEGGVITVSYATRGADEPMVATPTRMVSKAFVVVNGELVPAPEDLR